MVKPDCPKFGEIRFAQLPFNGSVQHGMRPVLIVQNDTGNMHSPTVEVLPLTSQVTKASHMPTHVFVGHNSENGLKHDSIILGENVLTIPMDLLQQPIGVIDELTLLRVALARSIQSPLPYAGV